VADKHIEELEARVEQLAIQCRALLELCVGKKVFTRAEYKQLAQEIDAVDGQVDGRVTRLKTPKRGD
jgi:hypothetical protein